jgi:P-type E1-E2 ATPase
VPSNVHEAPGEGVEGVVDGHAGAVGGPAWLTRCGFAGAEDAAGRLDAENGAGRAKVLIGVDGRLAGGVVLADRLRPDARDAVSELRRAGIEHVAMVTGDRRAVGEELGRALGVDRVYADLDPAEKLEVVRAMQARPELRPVVMAGDGINDAPALALADVGIAMGFGGATVSSQTADAVVVVDRVDRVPEVIRTGRRSLRIARESVLFGIGLSLVAMGFAAFGYIPPVAGALLQEAVDLAVILNALRALRG